MGTMLYTFDIGDGVMKNQKKSEINTLDFLVERDIRGEEKKIPDEKEKSKSKKTVLSLFLAAVTGIFFEIIYWAFGDVGLGFLDDCMDYLWKYSDVEFYAWFFLIYYIVIALAGIILIRSCRKKSGGMINLGTITIAIFAAIFVHHIFMAHDSVVYYQLHREIYPEVCDLGYAYFALYLGSVYPLWLLTIIITAFFKRYGKSGKKNEFLD